MRTQCTDRVHAIVVLQKKAVFSLQLDNQSITIRNRTYFIIGHVKIWVLQCWCLHFTYVCDGWVGLGEEKWTHVHL